MHPHGLRDAEDFTRCRYIRASLWKRLPLRQLLKSKLTIASQKQFEWPCLPRARQDKASWSTRLTPPLCWQSGRSPWQAAARRCAARPSAHAALPGRVQCSNCKTAEFDFKAQSRPGYTRLSHWIWNARAPSPFKQAARARRKTLSLMRTCSRRMLCVRRLKRGACHHLRCVGSCIKAGQQLCRRLLA